MVIRVELSLHVHKPCEASVSYDCVVTRGPLCYSCLLPAWQGLWMNRGTWAGFEKVPPHVYTIVHARQQLARSQPGISQCPPGAHYYQAVLTNLIRQPQLPMPMFGCLQNLDLGIHFHRVAMRLSFGHFHERYTVSSTNLLLRSQSDLNIRRNNYMYIFFYTNLFIQTNETRMQAILILK